MAEVGKTSMCVAVTSRGVCRCDWMEACEKRSSGVKRSAMRRRHESGSVDTRQADRMHGTPPGYSTEQLPQMSRSMADARTRCLRDSSQLQPATPSITYVQKLYRLTRRDPEFHFILNLPLSSPCPIRPTLPTTSLQGWAAWLMTPSVKSISFVRPIRRAGPLRRRRDLVLSFSELILLWINIIIVIFKRTSLQSLLYTVKKGIFNKIVMIN